MSFLGDMQIDVQDIKDEKIRSALFFCFNTIEKQFKEIQNLREENQKLKDAMSILQGEQGKPDIKGKNKKEDDENGKGGNDQDTNISSEKERKTSKKHKRKEKGEIQIDSRVKCTIDRDQLPEDAEYKGTRKTVIQDITITTNNTEFEREKWYSPSLHKTFIADLPLGYDGEFGPNIKAWAILLKHESKMTESKIRDLFLNVGIDISKGTITSILIKDKEKFHQEKENIFLEGLRYSFTQTDDTSSRHNGENWYTHIICNPFFSTFFTRQRKDRLTVLDILRNGKGRIFCFNEETFTLLEKLGISRKNRQCLKGIEKNKLFTEDELRKVLPEHIPKLGKVNLRKILDSSAIAAYHQEVENVVRILLCDDAPQFKHLTEFLGLCWIHDGRHYKKLRPIISHNKELLEAFLKKYWDFYRQLLNYKENPSSETALILKNNFDELFSTKTGYDDLDDRIAKTKAKKHELLLVLKFPEIPLHNNDSELQARVIKRYEDISLHTKTEEGLKVRDTFLSIIQTAKKLGVNIYDYLFDRISQKNMLPSLADLIKIKVQAV